MNYHVCMVIAQKMENALVILATMTKAVNICVPITAMYALMDNVIADLMVGEESTVK